YIAERKIDSFNNKPVNLLWNNDDLSMEVNTASLKTHPWLAENLSIHLKGAVKIAWLVDTKKLAEAVAGLTKNQVLAKISPLVDAVKVDISIRPAFWNNTLPSKASKIKVETIVD
ncbi:MAG: hypothetical protein WCO30_02785, partial [bacterium]